MADNKYGDMATRIKELMDGGKTLEEALSEINAKVPGSSRPVIADRIAWISELNNIGELRKAIKVAHAKRSKAKGTDKEEKYVQETKAGSKRLNELIAQVNAADDPIAKAVELGEEPGSILQLFIASKEKGLEDDLKAKFKECGFSNAEMKAILATASTATPADIAEELTKLGKDYLTSYENRAGKRDQRVLTLNRRWSLLHSDAIQPNKKTEAPTAAPKADKKSGKKSDNKSDKKDKKTQA